MTQTGVNPNELSLPPNTDSNVFQEFIVIKPIPEKICAEGAPWGDSPGGALQYDLPCTIQWLEKMVL